MIPVYCRTLYSICTLARYKLQLIYTYVYILQLAKSIKGRVPRNGGRDETMEKGFANLSLGLPVLAPEGLISTAIS
jgi:hypothetical protein